LKKFIIDRFEGVYAVCECEDKTFINIPKYKLPQEILAGDCLFQNDVGTFYKDEEIKKERENKIRSKMYRLFE